MDKIQLDDKIYRFFEKEIYNADDFFWANHKIKNICGICDFFESDTEYNKVVNRLKYNQNMVREDSRIEYGDFQTPDSLAERIMVKISTLISSPTVIIEPTCGKGAFVLAAIKHFQLKARYYCIEINKLYIWISKFRILDYFLEYPRKDYPEIRFIHNNIYDVNFEELISVTENDKLLLLGNPPWVTNTQLGILSSDNLPIKSNFKYHNGFDAITGKGNFDIAEYILLMLIRSFSSYNGVFAFLVKNIVIKNILKEQPRNRFRIGSISQLNIDCKKEFNVSADASLLLCSLNSSPGFICERRSLYDDIDKPEGTFGYYENYFVADLESYKKTHCIDGISPIIWRQGVKHDCTRVMELEKEGKHYINSGGDAVEIEEDLVYGLLKSSDLNKEIISSCRKYTIITQKKIGDSTAYIKAKHPKTYEYLSHNIESLLARKSKIYNDKPPFSIFGIGEYSFSLYKVAISGLYKQTKFSLVMPINEKPLMLDDTCYFIGFDNTREALIYLLMLNHQLTQEFLKSLIFFDSKRVITKEILMRIDTNRVMYNIPEEYFLKKIKSEYESMFDLSDMKTIYEMIEKYNATEIGLFG